MTRWFFACALLVACSSGPTRSEPAQLRADGRALRSALSNDHSEGPLHDVDNAITDRRPVLGAELIRSAAIPAVQRARAGVAAATTHTPEGNAARAALLEAYDQHLRTLNSYALVLDRGEVEDIQLLEAVHNERESEQAMDHARDGVERLEQAQ